MEETNLRPISKQLLSKCKNYIFPINIQGKSGTCFFINILVNNENTIYLSINYDLITNEFINSKGVIDINEKLKIKLDENRKIFSFKNQCKFILIEKDDNIPNNYILNLENELNPKEYINEDAYLLCYYNSNNNADEIKGGFIPGKILNINGYRIKHKFNTKNLLSVAPICIYNYDLKNNLEIFKAIGIQLENPEFENFKYMSYGYLLKYVLKESNIEFDGNNLDFEISLNSYEYFPELIKYSKYSFYTFDEYKNSIIKFHIAISRFYKEQTIQNFNIYYNIINKPEYNTYLKNLHLFKNIRTYQERIFDDREIVNNLNEILLSKDFSKINNFSYFISGFMYVLNNYSEDYICQFKNDEGILYTRIKLSLEELIELDKIANKTENEDKIITFKTFLNNVINFDNDVSRLLLNIKKLFTIDFSDRYDTKIYIRHHYKEEWKASCFTTLLGIDSKIFDLFTFFKVNEVKINFEEKKAEINLELVGKNVIFEEKFNEKGNEYMDYNIEYNDDENIIYLYR